ncbi:MAG: Trp biosynthesis-associated membrane protein, partial [Ornithinibacter sp.]
VVAYAVCVAVAVGLAVRVLLDPAGVLGPVAASRVGRTGSVETVADATIWPWVALVACAIALAGLAGALVGMRRWGGPTQRYEVPDGSTGVAAGPRGERVASDWDELSSGRDPTDVGPDAPT